MRPSLVLATIAAAAMAATAIAAGPPPAPAPPAPPTASSRPLVVELFTSEGCSSCPPADRLLATLAQQKGVLALGFHVTYWDNLGWHDPYSLAAATHRQAQYAHLFAQPDLFTPEMVVDGLQATVGSDASAVAEAMRRAHPEQPIALALSETPSGVTLSVGGGSGSGPSEASLLLFGYDPSHTTPVGRGENAGRTLHEADIVRSVTPAATWHGAASVVDLPRPAGERLVAVLQAPDGHILAVAQSP